ncbi:E3 ubiquitin-protein ligase TRIM71-like [Mercenaria mercenaria]|uniref:E3 ubiquitin-protein ligase TRIM71-like n=1 Tax=Mercenaria mercenaria TaxID=6596 RepID=UPI00234F31A4|nr:E3 ubiquitin-protein ligase TRIM71-like [Mercenaria mercenaria]
MAAALELSSIRSSPDKESEETNCSPCGREERKVEATKFCADCNEHLCEKCVHDHKKFVVTKTHRITAKEKPPSVTPRQKLTDKCTHHEGKLLELFCGDHDELCCSVCVAVGHRSCSDVVYIPQAATGVESSIELLQVKDAILKVKAEVDVLRNQRMENQRHVQQQKEDIINAILDMRIRITDILDKLEHTARHELQDRYDVVITKIDNDVKTCEDVGDTLRGLTSKIETTTNNEPELFVTLKKAKKSLQEGRVVVKDISKNLGKERLLFMADRTLENLLNTMTSLGEFGEDTHIYKAQFEGEYNISLSSDLGSSEDNTGSVCLPDGKVIVTNTHHKRLKLLNSSCRVIDHVDLPGKPYAVCIANPTEVVTSLREEKVLQFVTIEKKLKISRVMKVGVSCYGVACQNGEIFVACIGGQYENRPQLRVYNMSGRLLRVFERDTDGTQIFSSPRNLGISPDGTMIHVTDREYGVITVGLLGKVISRYKSFELDSPRGIAVDPDGDIFVCGQNSHNVVQLNAAGEEIGVVIKDRTRLYRPQSVCYIQKGPRSWLLLTFLKSKYVKLYALA